MALGCFRVEMVYGWWIQVVVMNVASVVLPARQMGQVMQTVFEVTPSHDVVVCWCQMFGDLFVGIGGCGGGGGGGG